MGTSDYAKSLVKQYDKNGNMILEADEHKALRGPAATADLNNDGTITVDELVTRLSNPSAAATPSASPSNSAANATAGAGGASNDSEPERIHLYRPRSRDGDERSKSETGSGESKPAQRVFVGTVHVKRGGSSENQMRQSYRFTPAAEHLPNGLPGWFKSRDKNGDGQLSMSEYSPSWSDRLVSEFRRYDHNNDGIITPKEAVTR